MLTNQEIEKLYNGRLYLEKHFSMYNQLYMHSIEDGTLELFLKYPPELRLINGLCGLEAENINYFTWGAIRYFCFLVREKYLIKMEDLEKEIPKSKFVSYDKFNYYLAIQKLKDGLNNFFNCQIMRNTLKTDLDKDKKAYLPISSFLFRYGVRGANHPTQK